MLFLVLAWKTKIVAQFESFATLKSEFCHFELVFPSLFLLFERLIIQFVLLFRPDTFLKFESSTGFVSFSFAKSVSFALHFLEFGSVSFINR